MSRPMSRAARQHLLALATPPPPERVYFAVGDIGAHEGYVTHERADNGWSSENESGWTYQDVCGPHGRILYEGPDKAAAFRELDAFLLCDAPATGAYCYSHNPEGT